ncbi:MAG TPA: hypothetical protein VHE10_02825 [Candidatus Paceibacterota bacterium]|nr:hypothetical protein [Candidatus Paceibacterota bacterium]
MKKPKAFAYSAVSIALAAALPVSAQVTGGLNTGVGADINIGSGTNAAVNVGGVASSSSNTSGNASSGVTVGGTVTAGASANAPSAHIETFAVSRSDAKATTTEYIAPANVTSQADFETYSKALVMADENVAKISTGDDYVSVWYHEPAKVLGVIPVTATVKATVDAAGDVSVDYPWWYGLFVKDDTAVDFKNDIDTTAGVIARGEASATLSSSAKARLVNAVRTTMKAHYDANVSASSSETAAY